jgi:hypothetical protein
VISPEHTTEEMPGRLFSLWIPPCRFLASRFSGRNRCSPPFLLSKGERSRVVDARRRSLTDGAGQ